MAQVLVPGVAQAVISGQRSGQPWACVMHWQFGGSQAAWSQPNIQLLADSIHAGWASNLMPFADSATTQQSVTTVDLGTSTPQIGSNATSSTGSAPGSL